VDLRGYLEVLRTPGVARVASFALLGRLPFGTLPLSILLLMRREHYDYGQIGAVLAAEALAVAATAVVAPCSARNVGSQTITDVHCAT